MLIDEYDLSPEAQVIIEGAQADMRSEHGVEPLAILALCRRLGVLTKADPELPEELAGRIEYRELPGNKLFGHKVRQYQISYPTSASIARQRFTVAHLLAHYLLHRSQLSRVYEENIFFRGGLCTRAEREATRLAGDILLPIHLIDEYTKGECAISFRSMATHFGVTSQFMTTRMGVPLDF